jgi:hypothetical protein
VSYNSITFNADHTVSDTSAQSLTNQALARGQAAPDGARTGVRVNVGAGQTFRMDVSPTGEATPVSQNPSTSSVNMGSIPNGEQGILSSLNRGGSVIPPSQARPDDIVTLPGGITTTLENAMARVAEQLGQQPEQAQETLNNMAMGVQAQFRVMARSLGLDPDQAADWIRTHRSDRVAAALQQHTLHRDVIGAWSGLLADVKRATARG